MENKELNEIEREVPLRKELNKLSKDDLHGEYSSMNCLMCGTQSKIVYQTGLGRIYFFCSLNCIKNFNQWFKERQKEDDVKSFLEEFYGEKKNE